MSQVVDKKHQKKDLNAPREEQSPPRPEVQLGEGPPSSANLDEEALLDAVRYNRRQGLTKGQVEALQHRLGLCPDGLLGESTTKAIYALQLGSPGLKATGQLDKQTRAALEALQAPQPQAQVLSSAQVQAAIRFNRHQLRDPRALRQLEEGLGARPEGIWRPELIHLLALWQRQAGMEANGRISPETLGRLQSGDAAPAAGRISAHFSWENFRSRGDDLPVPEEHRANVVALCQELEILQSALGRRRISISSGYRSPWWNARRGGAPTSLHLEGKAADFTVAGVRPSRVRQVIEDLIEQGRMRDGGLGRYNTFTHYDIRETPARWG